MECWIWFEEEIYSDDDEDYVNFVSSGVIIAFCSFVSSWVILAFCSNILAYVLMLWLSVQHLCLWLLLIVSSPNFMCALVWQVQWLCSWLIVTKLLLTELCQIMAKKGSNGVCSEILTWLLSLWCMRVYYWPDISRCT